MNVLLRLNEKKKTYVPLCEKKILIISWFNNIFRHDVGGHVQTGLENEVLFVFSPNLWLNLYYTPPALGAQRAGCRS